MPAADRFRAMNTDILVIAHDPVRDHQEAFKRIRASIAGDEARFSRFKFDSELSRLNQAAGRWFDCSPQMAAMLQKAAEVHHLTHGRFDPTILPALQAAGYDRSFEEGLDCLEPHRHLAAAVPGFDQLVLDAADRRVWMPEGMSIDLGGIAKGEIAAGAARILEEHAPSGAVSAGGDMSLFGLPPEAPGWEVTLEDPRQPSRDLGVLELLPGAIATSTTTKRRWQSAVGMQNHIIDPGSARSTTSDWLSVTVWARRAYHAEALAKAILIEGSADPFNPGSVPGGYQYFAIDTLGACHGNLKIKTR